MRRAKQVEMEFTTWGGRRRGAGRKRTGSRARVAHVKRPRHVARHPLHVTLRIADGVPSLRADAAQRVLRDVLRASAERNGLRIVQYSAQRDHLHLLCEAEDERALTRGMRGFGVRLAHALNRLWKRRGALLGDRYHARALRTPREVRNALAYVFRNARKHGERFVGMLDRCSSAPSFDGWKELTAIAREPGVLARARTWLLAIGWRRHGQLSARGP